MIGKSVYRGCERRRREWEEAVGYHRESATSEGVILHERQMLTSIEESSRSLNGVLECWESAEKMRSREVKIPA